MLKIMAIGGGEIGRPGFPVETIKIDKEIINLTGKKHPKFLFIPTASSDSEEYFRVVEKHFGKRLGCRMNVLYLIRDKLSYKEVKEKILGTDIIYVGGGNTLKMMMIWRKLRVDSILRQAYKKGIVLSGLSAGSICWFRYGSSDSRKFTSSSNKLIKVSGLGIINALHCPHYNVEKNRKNDLKRMMRVTPGVALAIDNCCALEVLNNKYRIISSKKGANAYKVFWKAGKYYEELIKQTKEFKSLNEILLK